MKRFRRASCVCLLGLSVFLPAHAWQGNSHADPWLIRSKQITDDLLKDSDTLTGLDNAFLYARLGKAWWKDDPFRAREWMRKAVQAVESADHEKADDNKRRLAAARLLLRLAAPIDPSSSETLEALIRSESQQLSVRERSDNATALVEAGLLLLESDPKRAAFLGSASFRIGVSPRLSDLLWQLRLKDRRLSDGLFAEALAAVRTMQSNQQRNLLNVILFVAFKGPAPSEELQKNALGVMAEEILRSPTSPNDVVETCRLAADAAPWVRYYAKLLPQKESMIQAALARCKPTFDKASQREVDESLSDQPLKSVEDFLRAASDASDQDSRNDYLLRAANLAAEHNDYEAALNILDRVRINERSEWREAWESRRWSYAAELASRQLKRGDYQGAVRTIEATPPDLRSFTLLVLARRALENRDRSQALEFAQEARKNLVKAKPSGALEAHFSLVRLFAELLPQESPSIFRETVKAVNEAVRDSSTRTGRNVESGLLENDQMLSPYRLPASILEVDEAGIQSAISLIEPRGIRVAVRMFLLTDSLKHRTRSSQSQ